METEGLRLSKPIDCVRKVGLLYILGDNLGAHCIAEMSQSFSNGNICRWCKANYNDVCRENLPYSECEDNYIPEFWTKSEYDRLASNSENGDERESCGIKGHCIFNVLDSFHCIGQLPPCLGTIFI